MPSHPDIPGPADTPADHTARRGGARERAAAPRASAPASLPAADMFTPGRAGGRRVLVWEGSAAAPASPLPWHSRTPVEVFFHTGRGPHTKALAQEFTRQLDRQLSALSLLSAERLLEGIRTYRTQGRQPMSEATRKARKDFMNKVMRELVDKYDFSKQDAADKRDEINDALVVLHESDQITFGPSQPGMSAGGYPSMGHGPVNSSIGSQGKPMATALEQAAQAIPADQRPNVRILVRAVLTDSPKLTKQLRNGQVSLKARSQAQQTATSPRAPPWTPGKVAADIANNTTPWQAQPTSTQPTPPSPSTHNPGWDPDKSAALRRASFPQPPSAALRKPPPVRRHTPEDVKAAINIHARRIRQTQVTPTTRTNPKHPGLDR